MALLWSLAIPGFGQLYNRDYIIGLLLITLEFLINVKSGLNLTILYSFRGQLPAAIQAANIQWLLFYPCVYSFSLWQAYNRGREINAVLNETNSSDTVCKTQFNGLFVGSATIGTLGIIYSYGLGPIFGGLIGMGGGALAGFWIEKALKNYII